ncbi:UDP-N-acetyl-D-glucosamine 2-epimerase, UDP-hydrolysing [Candidatus Giovannonibacteria bacterium RIFCSPLOWO2_01_FULL_46_13]|uniref:UDP-N-acetyl-D-glucosamine 2-epimerase, UDP-hydrolysing n=1 Tax=Candidatus Giovannonibacteria bacterium RIFCSPLOWO2_01_FULL_46_13 TaxID=1798352 RepID=A0A1F5X3Q5_9BACT|nr:MAG: UDP-N-acetyl-D-glucosamine 2-epimerase, UDP-hydrolysing [Candidatus Giovannonibacteria bacterium RIFCSPLOWO2_01_FULL_46_13]
MAKKEKIKICFPITSRIHYARQKILLDLLKKNPRVDLQLIVAGSVLLEKYSEKFLPAMKEDGFEIHDALYNIIEGGNHITMARTAGLTALEFASSLYKLNPDVVLIRGDRYELLPIAMVAAYLNKTIAHIEGGDVTGTIDESVRHAISKLAHMHFVTNEDSRGRLIRMGENPKFVFNVGSPDVEFASRSNKKIDTSFLAKVGVGHDIDFSKPYMMSMLHPVTTEEDNRKHMELALKAVDDINLQTIWFWPNSDAGTSEMAKAIRVYRELGILKNNNIKFVTDVLPEDFMALLKKARVMIGNSSTGIKECSYLGVPVVNIGTRQQGRLRGPNVLDVPYSHKAIKLGIEKQLAHGSYKSSNIYFKANTSKKMVEILTKISAPAQKIFHNA